MIFRKPNSNELSAVPGGYRPTVMEHCLIVLVTTPDASRSGVLNNDGAQKGSPV